jgi:hypothetical protein
MLRPLSVRTLRDPVHWLIALAATAGSLIWVPASFADAVYGGTTSKAQVTLEPIVVRTDVAAGVVKSVVIAWEAECSDQTVLPFSAELVVSAATPGFPAPPGSLVLDESQPGRFSGHSDHSQTRGDGSALVATTTIKGTLTTGAGIGTLSARATIQPTGDAPQITCNTGEITWRATRGPRIYGGVTSQREPVVVRTRRTRVSDLFFGWDTIRCTTGGPFRLGDGLSNFPLRRGRFGGSFTQTYPREDGVSSYRYRMLGRVGSSVAFGTFSVTWRRTFNTGTPPRTCTTGTVRWRAISG